MTIFHKNNMDADHIVLWTPQWVDETKSDHKILFTWLYMVGCEWGFEDPYVMHVSDVKTILNDRYKVENLASAFRKYRKWIQVAVFNNENIQFSWTGVPFEWEEWICTTPREQRLWIYLWTKIWYGEGKRNPWLVEEDVRVHIPIETKHWLSTEYSLPWVMGDHRIQSVKSAAKRIKNHGAKQFTTIPDYLKPAPERKARRTPR